MSDSGKVTIVVGRFDPLVRRGVKDALADDRRLDILASDLEDGILERTVFTELPCVVILGEAVDYALLARLKSSARGTGVLVLAHDPPRVCGTTLLKVGATCLAGNASPEDLIDAVHLAAKGDLLFISADGQRVQRPSLERARLLTDRETEVFGQLSKGRSDAAIALDLRISVATVRAHVRSVLRKLNVRSRRWLVGMSLPDGLGPEAG